MARFGRSQTKTPSGHYVKREQRPGGFMDVKTSNKGPLRREKGKITRSSHVIDISFEINGRKVSPRNVGNALESAMFNQYRTR